MNPKEKQKHNNNPPILTECNKMKAVSAISQEIGIFIEEFLRKKGIFLAKWHEHTDDCRMGYPTWQCGIRVEQPISINYNIEELLAEHFKIDLRKVEEEKRKMLEELRK